MVIVGVQKILHFLAIGLVIIAEEIIIMIFGYFIALCAIFIYVVIVADIVEFKTIYCI